METAAKKILIVDDHAEILEVVSEVLQYQHFDVCTMADGSSLNEQLTRYAPDLVIMDYKLGNENGGELCLKIKTDEAFKQIPVILYSAYLPATADVYHYGCDDILAKPFDMEDLLVRINRLLN
jgi:DNA-binding response OmpR family regulator